MKTLKLKLILLSLVISCLSAYSQGEYTYMKNSIYWNTWSISGNVGTCLFYGDVENYKYYKSFENNSEWKSGLGFIIQKQFTSIIAARGQVVFGQLSGTKRTSNIWFETDFMEINANIKINFVNMLFSTKQRKYSFYGTLGVGKPFYRTTLMSYNDNKTLDQETSNESFVIPFGAGADYLLDKNWSLNFELTMRILNSDNIDLKEGGFEYDMYAYIFVGVNYKFLYKMKKTTWRKNSQTLFKI